MLVCEGILLNVWFAKSQVCKEVRGCGIEAVITKVENCLADGNLLEAAATLEKGLKEPRVKNW
jgi:hypothetical protein